MLDRLRIPGLGGWGEDPLWGRIYDWTVEHPQPGGTLWRFGIGSEAARARVAGRGHQGTRHLARQRTIQECREACGGPAT